MRDVWRLWDGDYNIEESTNVFNTVVELRHACTCQIPLLPTKTKERHDNRSHLEPYLPTFLPAPVLQHDGHLTRRRIALHLRSSGPISPDPSFEHLVGLFLPRLPAVSNQTKLLLYTHANNL